MQTRLLKFVKYEELENGEIVVYDPESVHTALNGRENLMKRSDDLISHIASGPGFAGQNYCIIGLADPIAQYRELGRLYDLEKQFEKLVKERDDLAENFVKAKEVNRQKDVAWSAAMDLNRELAAERDQLKKELAGVMEQRNHLDHRRAVLEADVKALKCNCADSKKALEHEIVTGDKLRAELHEVKEERDQLKKERDELAQQLSTVRDINRERKVATNEANAALRKQVSTLQSERDKLRNDLIIMRHLSADLTARCVRLEEELRVMKNLKDAEKSFSDAEKFVREERPLKASDIARKICRDMTELPDVEPFDHPRLLKVFKFKDLKPGEVVIPHREITEEESHETYVVKSGHIAKATVLGIETVTPADNSEFMVVGLPGVDQCNTMCSLVNTYNRVLSERNALAEIRDVALADAQDWRERHGEVSDALGEALELIEKLHKIYHG